MWKYWRHVSSSAGHFGPLLGIRWILCQHCPLLTHWSSDIYINELYMAQSRNRFGSRISGVNYMLTEVFLFHYKRIKLEVRWLKFKRWRHHAPTTSSSVRRERMQLREFLQENNLQLIIETKPAIFGPDYPIFPHF